jgi:hypothetical protein
MVRAEVGLENLSGQTIEARSVKLELQTMNGIVVGTALEPSVGHIPAAIPAASRLGLEFVMQTAPGFSGWEKLLRANAYGVDRAGTPWKATTEKAV